jgi:type IV secretory pathway VirB2 component (pilin)
VPGIQFQLESYAGKIRALSVVWFIYAGLALVTGIMGLAFAKAFLGGHFGPWTNGPWAHGPLPPEWIFPAALHFVWLTVVIRVVLAIAAGYGLMERAQWGRIVAIVAAILSLLKFPFGTALGIWTLVVLLGYRNSTLYDQLP